MHLKPFVSGRYNDQMIVVQNPANGSQSIFSEEEFEIANFLKDNEKQTLLALLLPNIGIAKKKHIVLCVKVLQKLKKIGIVDYYSLIGKSPASTTTTVDLSETSRSLDLMGFHPFFQFIFKVTNKILGKLPSVVLLILFGLLGLASTVFFPFNNLASIPHDPNFSYLVFFALFLIAGQSAFIFRSILQSGFLTSTGNSPGNIKVRFFFPFLYPTEEASEINLAGRQSKLMMEMLGIVSPFVLAFMYLGLLKLGLISLSSCYVLFFTSILMALVFSCPLFSFDIANILSVVLFPNVLEERISEDFKEIFHKRGSLSTEMLVSLLVLFVWLIIWLDNLRTVWESFSGQIIGDLYTPAHFTSWIGATFWLGFLFFLLVSPCLVFLIHAIKQRILSRKSKVTVNANKLKDSLSFEERMAVLEKIPLFTYLDDQGRLSLLNEMVPMYYKDGAYLMHQGEIGKEFYVLVRGKAVAYYKDHKGNQVVLSELTEGDAFGEIALIDDVPRTASIYSDGGCIVLALQKEGFYRFADALGSLDRVKSMIRLTSFFRRHPLISKLKARDQADLIDRFGFLTLTAGEEVTQVEDDSVFYLVYSGKIRVDTGDDDSEMFLESDDCFGYSNALRAKYYAIEGTGLLTLPKTDFESLVWLKLVERPELFF